MQQWGGSVQVIREGDMVSIPPGVKHWHGATATTSMTHIAIQEQRDGNSVRWMEKVSDEQYRATRVVWSPKIGDRRQAVGASGGVKSIISGERWQFLRSLNPLKHNGQRWGALAVQDYESRALPLSYGGGKVPNLAM